MAKPKELYGRLAEIWDEIPEEAKGPLEEHLLGGTSSDWLADVLTSEGYKIGATTIRRWRRNRKAV